MTDSGIAPAATDISHEQWRPRVNPWIITVSVLLATFMEILDTSIAVVALPHIAGNLSATTDEATWVLTSYLIANAIILPASGWFAIYFGRKRFLIACIAIFTISSFMCGAATSLGMLVVARIFQGAGGGALQPLSQAILLESFPPQKRGMAMAAFGIGVVVAPIVGPTLGGWLTDDYSWRWAFYINIPVGALAIYLNHKFVEDPPYIKSAKPGSIDAVGFGLMVLALGTLQVILDKGQLEGWFEAPWIRWLTAITLASTVLFVVWELSIKEPIVNLRVFLNRNFAVGTILMTLLGITLYSTVTMQPLFLQELMGYTALKSGLAVSPRGLGSIALMPLVGFLTGIIDNRLLIGFGFLMLGTSLFLLGNVNLDVAPINMLWPTVLTGVALGSIFVPLTTLAMGMLKKQEMGNASGLFNLMRNVGGSVGISAVTTFLARGAQTHQSALVAHITPENPGYQMRLGNLRHYLETYFDPVEATRKAQGIIYGEVQRQSMLLAFVENFRMLAFISIGCIAIVFLLKSVKAQGRPVGH